MGLACGRDDVVDPDGNSEVGAETRMVGMIGRIDDGGGNIGARTEVGGGDRVTGREVDTGVAISTISVRGSVWVETDM